MSISARFEADFASFQTAVRGAEVSLKSFETGAGRVETALNRMVDSFSGRKVVQDANLMVEAVERIGGVSKLTSNELDRMASRAQEAVAKMRALGLDVPAGLQQIADRAKLSSQQLDAMAGQAVRAHSTIAEHTNRSTRAQDVMLSSAKNLAATLGVSFSVGTIVAFGRQLLELSDNLVKTSDRTGLTIEEVQRLSFVAGQSGNTIDELTAAVGKLQVNLNDPKALSALKSMRVDLDALRSSGPYEAIRLIAAGFSGLKSPVDQAEAAVAIFGKNGLAILPTLKSKFDELANGVSVASARQVKALEEAGDALDRLKTRATNWAVGTAGNVALVIEKYGLLQTAASLLAPGLSSLAGISFNEMAESATSAAEAVENVAAAQQKTVNPLVEYRKHLAALRKESGDLSDVQKVLIRQGHELGESNSQIAIGLGGISEVAVAAYLKMVDGAKKAAEETEKLRIAEQKLFFDIKLFGIQQMEEMTAKVNGELRKQMDAMGAAAAQLFIYGAEAKKSYQSLFDPAPIQGFEAELQKLDQWLATELKKLDAMAAAAGSAWKGQADEIREAIIEQYERMFADVLNKADDFSQSQLPAAIGASDGRLGSAAERAAQPMVVAFSNAFSQIERSAATAYERVQAMLATDRAYRDAGFFVDDTRVQGYRGSMLAKGGFAAPTSAGITINVSGGASQADGRAAADGFVSTMKQKGVQL